MRSTVHLLLVIAFATLSGCATQNEYLGGGKCSSHDECPMGGYMCLGGICKTPWEDNYAHSQANPADDTPTVAQSAPLIADQRAEELNEFYMKQLAMARSGQTTYLNAARAHQEDFFRLYPEERGNVYVKEYLSYMVLLGEKIDHKLMTEAQAEYELARKYTELAERVERVTQQQQIEDRQAMAQQAAMSEQQRILAEQRRKERGAALYNFGLQILQWNHEQALAGQMGRQNCIWTRTFNGGYIQTCQ
jgi:hypothetical protein